MWTLVFYCHLLSYFVAATEPPRKLLLNELGLDEPGGTSCFIEVKRDDDGTQPISLEHHYLAILNTGLYTICTIIFNLSP